MDCSTVSYGSDRVLNPGITKQNGVLQNIVSFFSMSICIIRYYADQ
jgi:hypothetical protein